MKDPLGDVMKSFEHAYRRKLSSDDYVLMRLDGKAFHSYTRGLEKPFDPQLMEAMNRTTEKLCSTIQGVRLAYTESDEISLLITGWKETDTPPKNPTELWMGGVEAKLISISAAIATAEFNAIREEQLDGGWGDPSLHHPHTALFDSRVWTFPGTAEGYQLVKQYFEWRRADSIRNSITMAASTHFSHKQLEFVNSTMKCQLLREKGFPWETLPDGFKFGRLLIKDTKSDVVTFTHKVTNEVQTIPVQRTYWKTVPYSDLEGVWTSETLPAPKEAL